MNEEKRRVNAYITNELYTRVIQSGYGITDAIIRGLECLMSHQGEIKMDGNEDILELQEALIRELQDRIKDMQEAMDPMELGQLRIKSEELEKHNETLKKELESASQREQDLKSMHNNYMMQMQTLINQKAIEVPGIRKPWWRFW
jgi:TolA-binding protein